VVVGWLAAFVFVAGCSNAFGGKLSTTFEAPASESQRAFDLLFDRFPEQADAGAQIVFRTDATVDDAGVRMQIAALDAQVEKIHGIAEVVSPIEPAGAFQVSKDRHIAFARVRFATKSFDLPTGAVKQLLSTVSAAKHEGFQAEVGGQIVQFAAQTGTESREGIGLLAAIVVLLFTFGSVVAMGLPLATALFGLGVALLVVPLLSRVVDVPIFGPSMAVMIGLGVGIDYALFIITRFRTALHEGSSSEDACGIALATSGRAVIFAGMTVCISMLGLFVMGISMVHGMALSSMVAVLVTVAASITLLPALLGFAGTNVDRLALPGLKRRDVTDEHSRWFRWSRFIQRHPWPAAVASLLVLLLLASPVLSMRLGESDAGTSPKGTTVREAYDLMAKGFGPGFNGPLVLAARIRDMRDVQTLDHVAAAARATPGVALAAPPLLNKAADAGVVLVVPSTSPQAEETQALIRNLRHDVIPHAVGTTGLRVDVGGVTSMYDDLTVALSARLPLFMAVVIGLSFLLLLVVFRSVLVPLKAAIMNLLSIGASYGVIVAVFQWGWFGELIGVDRTGPIPSFAPMLLFAVLFRLSMDYEVFLISRMREEYFRTGDNALAVADGLATTARVITAAAAIMITVFASFVFNPDSILKLFGLGLATAIFMDATIVRTVLVPATMELLGDRNWWFPAWLDRLVPNIAVEGHAPEAFDLTDAALAAEIDSFPDEVIDLTDEVTPAMVSP
jgi:RND superfamily putative drug exporter